MSFERKRRSGKGDCFYVINSSCGYIQHSFYLVVSVERMEVRSMHVRQFPSYTLVQTKAFYIPAFQGNKKTPILIPIVLYQKELPVVNRLLVRR